MLTKENNLELKNDSKAVELVNNCKAIRKKIRLYVEEKLGDFPDSVDRVEKVKQYIAKERKTNKELRKMLKERKEIFNERDTYLKNISTK